MVKSDGGITPANFTMMDDTSAKIDGVESGERAVVQIMRLLARDSVRDRYAVDDIIVAE